MKVLVLGGGGMLGHVMVRALAASDAIDVAVTVRSQTTALSGGTRVWTGVDATQPDALIDVLHAWRPDLVINCVGLVKQRPEAEDPLVALPINAILPHRLARLCALAGARLIHFSTDCVFSGQTGNYRESDIPDAQDLYGRSKLLGEVHDKNAVTLRVSIIGPELQGAQGLLAWFLAQTGPVRGFRRAVFSGLTTLELANVVRDRLLPRSDLYGLYHLSADPITKFDLLTLAGQIFAHPIRIDACDEPVIDRSLDSTRLRAELDYEPPSWPEMLSQLRNDTLHA